MTRAALLKVILTWKDAEDKDKVEISTCGDTRPSILE